MRSRWPSPSTVGSRRFGPGRILRAPGSQPLRAICAPAASAGTEPALVMNERDGSDMEHMIEAEGLRKRFGDTRALDGVDLVARRGSVLGVLGPNGAGKTTAVRILATLITADAGTARVAGHGVAREPGAVGEAIGLTGQY